MTNIMITGLSALDANMLVEELPKEDLTTVDEETAGMAGQQGDLGLSSVTFVLSAMAISGITAWLLKNRSQKKSELNFKLSFPNGVTMESSMKIDEDTSTTSEELAKSFSEVFSALAGFAVPA